LFSLISLFPTMKFTLVSAIGCVVAQDVFLAKQPIAASDLIRANTRKQSGRLAGTNAQEIADKLNSHLSGMNVMKECDLHSLDELNALMEDLLQKTSMELSGIYQQSGDSRSKRFENLAEYQASWIGEIEKDLDTLRHSKCAEITLLFAHHLSESAKSSFAKVLPTVPVYNETKASDPVYASTLSCKTGHAMTKGGDGSSTHEWPDWPEELHYKAKAHGAYPFWWGGGSDSADSDIEVWWSEKQGYELFAHSSCTGNTAWMDGSACYHLMMAPVSSGVEPMSYLFNEAAKQGKSSSQGAQCCSTNPTTAASGQLLTLAPSQGSFWNTFDYQGVVDFKGVNYQGQAKHYTLENVPGAIADFWYFTDLDGKPVQQGEAGTGPTDQGYPTSFGHTIWHDYDQSTFDSSAQDSSVSAVPAYCLVTTSSCPFP